MLITCPCLLTNHVQLETAAMDTAGGDAHGTLHSPKQACGLSTEHRRHGTPQCLVTTSDTSLGHACPMPGVGAGTKALGKGGDIPGKGYAGQTSSVSLIQMGLIQFPTLRQGNYPRGREVDLCSGLLMPIWPTCTHPQARPQPHGLSWQRCPVLGCRGGWWWRHPQPGQDFHSCSFRCQHER